MMGSGMSHKGVARVSLWSSVHLLLRNLDGPLYGIWWLGHHVRDRTVSIKTQQQTAFVLKSLVEIVFLFQVGRRFIGAESKLL